ncbi:uncharacterized protein [Henckelia pumila]|uniref:uncharacterized protein n=1 Tax=Henckelia pumila TaxID=405737 RepID=UPI003C6E5B8B
MADHGDKSSHGSVGGRWGDQNDREHRQGRHHHRHDDHRRFSMHSRGVATWDEFRTTFHNLYFPSALRQAKASELLSLRQGSMSINEYKLKFFELLPNCPQISYSTEAKYNLFLQGLNPEIHDRVVVGYDMTYERLVSRCHQAEDSIRERIRVLASIVVGIILPTDAERPQGVFLMRRDWPPEEDCPQAGEAGSASGSGSQALVQQRPQGQSTGGSNLKPRASSQVFALRHDQAVYENEKVIAGTLLLFDIPAFALIDTALKSCRALESGAEGYLIYVVDTSAGSVGIEAIPIVNEFSDDLLDKGYVRPSFSPCGAPVLFVKKKDGYGVFVDPSNIEAVMNWSCPMTVAEIRCFLGLEGYYRRFIANFMQLARPLTQLTRKGVHFEWSSECEDNFCELHRRLTSAPMADPKTQRLARLTKDDSTSGFHYQSDGFLFYLAVFLFRMMIL